MGGTKGYRSYRGNWHWYYWGNRSNWRNRRNWGDRTNRAYRTYWPYRCYGCC